MAVCSGGSMFRGSQLVGRIVIRVAKMMQYAFGSNASYEPRAVSFIDPSVRFGTLSGA
jgi:hypothetical protein